jgi:serine/threonine protein kinase
MLHALPFNHILQNRYIITGLIGQGGFGITYIAHDNKLDLKVCIKELFISGYNTRGSGHTVLTQGKGGLSFPDFLERFVEEARQLARFNHPNIVRVLDIFQEHQTAYMVMEFVEGETFKEIVQDSGPINFEQLKPLIKQLFSAVSAVHAKAMLHRDIKPDNILVDDQQRLVLIDFGSAREFAEGKTGKQTAIVTPGFAPPEQYNETAKRGPFTDVYALGATLYYVLTAVKPLTVTDRVNEKMPSPRELNSNLSKSVSEAIMKALELKPENRYANVSDFESTLLKEEKIAVKKEKQEIIEQKPIVKTVSQKEQPPKKKSELSPGTIAIYVVLAIIVLAGFFVIYPYISSAIGAGTDKEENVVNDSADKGTTEKEYYDMIVGKRLYYSMYPKIGDGSTPYQNFCFLENGKLLGSANETGAPNCPTEYLYQGSWKIEGEYLVLTTSNEYGNHFKSVRKIELNKIKDLQNYKIELGKELYPDFVESEMKYDIKFQEIGNNKWVFDGISLHMNFIRQYPHGSERELKPEEFSGMSKSNIRIMRNEIFANYGYIFKDQFLSKIFSESRNCFQYHNVDAFLSPIEIKNVETILKAEKNTEDE